MNWKSLLFSFEGRVGRGPYWGLLVVSLLVFGVFGAMGVMSALNTADPASAGGGVSIAMVVVCLAFLWPTLAIQGQALA